MATTILVVDDEPVNRDLLQAILVRQGHRVGLAASGQEALAAIATAPPDLVLLDLLMPGMSGLEVCRRLRADPRTREIPVLVVTAAPDLISRDEALTEGAGDYVTRPIRADDLRARVHALLAVRHLREEPARTLAYLRALDGTPAAKRSQGLLESPPEGAGTGPTRVLVVDDTQLARDFYSDLLGGQGFAAYTASSGEAALEFIARQPVEVVVSDIVMPGMSGLKLLERLRAIVPSLPVLMLTAFPTSQNAIAALKLGAFDFLVKGLDPSLIGLAVHRAAQHGREAVARQAEILELRRRVVELEARLNEAEQAMQQGRIREANPEG